MLNDFGLAKSSYVEDDDDSIIRFSPYKEEKLKEMMLSFIPHDFHPKFDQWFRLFVKEEIELSHQSKTIKHVSRNSELKNLELAISNVVSLLSTGDLIKGIGDVPVKVNLINSHTKDVVKSGPEASGKVEIVVVEAEADNRVNDLKNILVLRKGQFEMISQERERRKHSCRGGRRNRSARVNKICLKLIEGTAVLPTVSFVREKKWMKISNLRLQARFMDDFKGIQVKEAQTEPFTLKDRRIQASKKHVIPSLDDDICQLDEVDKVGLLDRSLTEARIKPMGDYIDRLYLYPQHLEEISEGANDEKSLKSNVEHARKYPAANALAKSEVITPSHESIILAGRDLQINASLFGSVLPDGQYPNPQFLPEPLRTHYNKIYRDFESLCTSNQLETEPGSKWVGTETSQRNRFCKIWRMLFCVVTFTKVLGDSHAHKKQRLS